MPTTTTLHFPRGTNIDLEIHHVDPKRNCILASAPKLFKNFWFILLDVTRVTGNRTCNPRTHVIYFPNKLTSEVITRSPLRLFRVLKLMCDAKTIPGGESWIVGAIRIRADIEAEVEPEYVSPHLFVPEPVSRYPRRGSRWKAGGRPVRGKKNARKYYQKHFTPTHR